MANRYYLVDVSGPANRWTQIVGALAPVPGRRTLSHDILHWRASLDNTQRMIQAETNDSEHLNLLSYTGVSWIGNFDEATGQAEASVHIYLAANAAAWTRPKAT